MGTQLSLPRKGGTAAKFLAHVYCGQTAGWIKMPLGTKVGHIVLHGDPAPPKTNGHSPQLLAHGYRQHAEKKFGKGRACGSEDMLANRQTNTQTDALITILRHCEVTNCHSTLSHLKQLMKNTCSVKTASIGPLTIAHTHGC